MKTLIEKAEEYQDKFGKTHYEFWNLSRNGVAVIMAEFAEAYHQEKMRKELIKFAKEVYSNCTILKAEEIVDNYLKSNQ